MSVVIYDIEGSNEIDAEFVVLDYRFNVEFPLEGVPPEQETAEQFNITPEQVLDIVKEWEADRNA